MTVAWVVGSGGLLGSALGRVLAGHDTTLFAPAERFRWQSVPERERQIGEAVRAFASRIGAGERWELYWAAGVGSMGSLEANLAEETRALAHLLDLLLREANLRAAPAAVAFASSAGSIYAGATEPIISERSSPSPNTPYARAKIEQEEIVTAFARAHGRSTALIARLSTLYGPGQSHGKPQGLIAHIARALVRNQPVRIYVPLDTVRDYLAADDAAAAMFKALEALAAVRAQGAGSAVLTKIFASERPTTIAEIVAVFRRIARRAPRIITSASRLSALYPRRMRFASVAARELSRPPRVSLLVGVSEVLAAERALFARGAAPERRRTP